VGCGVRRTLPGLQRCDASKWCGCSPTPTKRGSCVPTTSPRQASSAKRLAEAGPEFAGTARCASMLLPGSVFPPPCGVEWVGSASEERLEAWQDPKTQSKVVAPSPRKGYGPAAGGLGVPMGRVSPALAFLPFEGF